MKGYTMGMGIFDPLIHALTPHMQDFKHIGHSMGERMISRLDLILMALQSEDFAEMHPQQNFILTVATPVDMRAIPTTENWELEAVAAYSSGATPIITIRDGAGGKLFYADSFTSAAIRQGLGIILPGGSTPNIVSEQSGATVMVQFKRQLRMPAQLSHTAGLGGVDNDQLTDSGHDPHGNQDYSLIPRHMQPLNHGQNVNGFDGNIDHQLNYRG